MQQNMLKALEAGTEQITPQEEFIKKLESGKQLTIKLGMDPTSPDLHLGHTIVLSKLQQFLQLGHHVIFLIGDFTARIGDPTGRSKTRPPLTQEQIAYNMQTYFDQVGRVLDTDKITVRYNSEWLGSMTSTDLVSLCAHVTLARVIERQDFAERLKENRAIGLHELLYPLMQGYDSVALHADVELGGTDQTFNLLMGRYIQQQYGQDPQVIMTLPILEGLDGVEKMSKSLGNAIGLTEPPEQVFGKLMSISDELMWRYYALLLGYNQEKISTQKQEIVAGTAHPMALKKQMAHKIISRFWSKQDADTAEESFVKLFEEKEYSAAQPLDCTSYAEKAMSIASFLKEIGAVSSTSEARRLIEAGAVKINNEKITDYRKQIDLKPGMILKVGKHRFYKVIIGS